MRRRGSHEPAIDLFSFQDIVCAVIGMVFFVVLIMALNIVETKATGTEGVTRLATEADVTALRSEVAALRDEVAKAEDGIEHSTARLGLASGDEKAALDEVQRLEATLNGLYERLKQTQEVVAQAGDEKKKTEEARKKKQGELDALKRRIEEIKAQLKKEEATPRIAFIMDQRSDNLEPWLVEISGENLRVASRDGRGAVLDFGGTTKDQRQQRFLEWAKSQNNRTHYFVLLMKPTGVEQAQRIQKALRDLGFEIGTDLFPEDWKPFQG